MNTVAREFAHTLKEIGVKFVFGVPSGNMIDYIEAIRQEEGIEFVLTGHESSAAFMAAVCGRLTGVPGACFGTFGPGATNLATGVGCALLDRMPALVFTDEMPAHLRHRTVQMNIDHQTLFQPLTKWTTRIDKDNVVEVLLKASGIAIEELPGPVHIGVPAGIGNQLAGHSDEPFLRFEKEPVFEAPSELMEFAKRRFKNARKPLLAVGLTAVRAGIQTLILNLAEKFCLPVVLTPMAKGMFSENHPLYAGVLFHALSNHVAQTYSEADLVIGIGYDPVEFNYEDWMLRVPLLHFCNRPADVDRDVIPDVTDVLGELQFSVNELLKVDCPPKSWNRKTIEARKLEMFRLLEPPEGSFGPLAVVSGLREALPENGILTLDVGAHLHLAGQMWKTPSPEKLLMTNGWSSMGFGIPAAIAAKHCRPELPVACLTGDGGFRMMAGEMATARQLGLNVVFVVVVDDSLSLIRIKQKKQKYQSNYGTSLPVQPEKPSSHYFGVPVYQAKDYKSYIKILAEAFSASGPVIIEAFVDGKEYDELVLQKNK
ncbi:thiamine pyrophosphate-binding protein [Mariniphaga sp.]|uniref:thiamine pyrophosphate-binding protein n=1 Tax=Mariniphaga sp. TaxID=1954475 RepID=UPI003569F69F